MLFRITLLLCLSVLVLSAPATDEKRKEKRQDLAADSTIGLAAAYSLPFYGLGTPGLGGYGLYSAGYNPYITYGGSTYGGSTYGGSYPYYARRFPFYGYYGGLGYPFLFG